MRFGLRLIQWLGEPRRLVELAVLAEHAGFDQVWFPHDPFMYQTWALTAAVAARTERITVASIATNPYTTDPAEIATYLATLDLLTNGRAAIGIGLHTNEMVGWSGHDASDRIERTRTAVELVRRLLRGETAHGSFGPYHWSKDCYLRFEPLRPDPPIYIAAYGPGYLALSGEIGDGSLPMITPPQSAPYMVKHILAGVTRAERHRSEIDIAGCAWLSISETPRAAAEALRPMIAYFGPHLETPALATIDLDPAQLAPLKKLVDNGELENASKAVTEQMLQLAIVGTPQHVIASIEALAEVGITQINLGGPLGPDPAHAISLLGQKVIPHFR